MILLIVLLVLAWFAMGIWGFIFWWTTEHDFTSKEIPACLFIGIAGPLTFLIGHGIHSKAAPEKIIFKKKL